MKNWITQIEQSFEKPLPGWEAQRKMINYDRPEVKDVAAIDPEARKGGVLVLLYPYQGSLHTVLTLRHEYRGVHSGQVSFPGGKMEDMDQSLWDTALREAQEEVGLSPNAVKHIGALSQIYIPPSRFLVSPYLAVTTQTPRFVAEPEEVARIIQTPLSLLLDEKTVSEKAIHVVSIKSKMQVRYFDIDGETVWGATAMILSELVEIARRDKWVV